MSHFDVLYPLIMSQETSKTNPTGLVEIPGDLGGLTKWGISQAEWSRVYHRYPEYSTSVKDLTSDQARVIYSREFYPTVCDSLPLGPALVVFDCNVNQGIGIRVLQEALGVTIDGIVGPETTGAIRLAVRDIPRFTESLIWARVSEYVRISKASTVNQGFLAKLWLPRLISIRQAALQFGASE